jgi:hypothetical protein
MERLRVARYLAKLPFVRPPVIENGTDPGNFDEVCCVDIKCHSSSDDLGRLEFENSWGSSCV